MELLVIGHDPDPQPPDPAPFPEPDPGPFPPQPFPRRFRLCRPGRRFHSCWNSDSFIAPLSKCVQ